MASKKNRYTDAVNKYYPLIYSAVYTKVNNVDDAYDICQEVFVKFFEKFEEVENPRKWLYGALRLSVFDYYRSQNKATNIDEVFNDIGLTFVNGFRDARIIISEVIENIDTFDKEEDKLLFDLIAINNFSYSQVGKQLGLTKRQVQYKYGRIVQQILDQLNKRGIKNIEDLL
ncbi:MAG: sigma-70 family RNA polymerase sigma factor [Spirochaetota bacterium]|nr:sigma-70 family RNA polymerase sigma factor [Spirochaetota bacterium]